MKDFDKDLFYRMAAGDGDAYDQVYNYHFELVVTIYMRSIRDRAKAEDLAQDFFTKLWNTRKTFEGVANPAGYFYSMYMHLLMDYMRAHQKRIEALTDQLDEVLAKSDIPDDVYTEEHFQILDEGINSLSPQKQTIVFMTYFKGVSAQEISLKLKIAPATVRSKAYLARLDLKHFIQLQNNNTGYSHR